MFEAAIAAASVDTPMVLKTVPGLQLHVDGDYLANFDGAVDIPVGDARNNLINRLAMFKARVGADSVVVHNTAPGCHKGERYLIATVKKYQEQRTGKKPVNCDYLKDWLQTYEGPLFRSKTWATREADDGIAACSHFGVGSGPGYIAIATADKDMRMLPGAHICWRNPSIVTRVKPGAYDVVGADTKQYGLKFFWLQMLMGDGADNCPGLEQYKTFKPNGEFHMFKRLGEKTAEALLEHTTTSDEAFAVVYDLYLNGYHNTPWALDRFCEQAALMWMRIGNDAAVADFARHVGHSRINRPFTPALWDAVARLEERVKLARTTINAFGDSSDPLCADSLAG
jgi:hypothetical protein